VTAPTGERAVTRPQFPYGMCNTATVYTSSASTDVAAYEDLPGHHLLVVRNLIATTNDESYHGSASELPPRDLVWVRGVGLLRHAGPNDVPAVPRRTTGLVAPTAPTLEATTPHASASWLPSVTWPTVQTWLGLATEKPSGTPERAHINAQLAQARELEAKLAEEYHAVRLLRASIAGEAYAHGERVRELGK
jgi:hypothetical protein